MRRTIIPICIVLLIGALDLKAYEVDSARVFALGEIIDFTGETESSAPTIAIRANGKLLKRITTPSGNAPQVVATFNGHEGDYVLLRTSMGQGVCASGNLYALRFYRAGESGPIDVSVSSVLTACLGEWPPVKFIYSRKGDLVINVSGYELRGPAWGRWTKEKR